MDKTESKCGCSGCSSCGSECVCNKPRDGTAQSKCGNANCVCSACGCAKECTCSK